MERFVMCVLLLTCAFTVGESANVLGIFPHPGRSHYVMFESLVKGLAEKGHDVDVVTHFPSKHQIPSFHELSIKGSLPIFTNNLSVSVFDGFTHYDMVHFITTNCGTMICEATLNTPVLENLKNTQKKYDILLTEIFGTDCMLGFAHLFEIPVVALTSSVALPWANDRIGNPDNPSYIPNYFGDFNKRMSLLERILNTLTVIKSKVMFHYYSVIGSNRIARSFFGQDLPRLEDLAAKTNLYLVNSHFSMNDARPAVPNFVEVGGLHIKEPKPLPKIFEDILNITGTPYKGVIYLTMGSMILTETFPVDRLQGMFDAFSELPYKVLWKGIRENFPQGLNIPDNIHFEFWMPQMDILCHPSVKMFVSHGGLMGSQEAVYCGVPRLGIPLFADQINNVRLSERNGLAIKVDYNDINKRTILSASQKLLSDPMYQHNAKKTAAVFKDRPLSPLDTAIYWVEYVIKYDGAPQLRTIGADLPWYQYYLVDVGVILVSIVALVAYVVFYMCKVILGISVSSTIKDKNE